MRKFVNILIAFLFVFIPVSSQTSFNRFPSDERINSELRKYVEEKELAGIITVVADADNIISLNCIGSQNTATGKPMQPNTLFWIASQTKPITGTAIMILVEEGLLDLDEPITTYLPEMKKLSLTELSEDHKKTERIPTKPITLRHLLSHTSGMNWVAGVQDQMGKIDVLPLTVSSYVSAMTPLKFEAGEDYHYSNQGINVAAAILERVSGMSYEEFLQKRIFEPLGMTGTTFWPTEEQLTNFAPPHKKDNAGKLIPSQITQLQYPLQDIKKRFPEAGGGVFSTPVDLLKFYQMILNGGTYNGIRILSRESIREMGKRQTPEGGKMDSYGLGWRVSPEHMGHSGACGSESRAYLETGYILMYIAQENGLEKNKEAQRDFWRVTNELYKYRK